MLEAECAHSSDCTKENGGDSVGIAAVFLRDRI